MTTFLKIVLCVIAAILAIKLLPVLLAPVLLVGLVALLLAGLLLGSAGLVASIGVALLAGFFVLALVLLAVLSPIWIPVLLIVGLVALLRKVARA